jgi:hypothetical protein
MERVLPETRQTIQDKLAKFIIILMHESECYFFLHLLHQNSCLVFVKKNIALFSPLRLVCEIQVYIILLCNNKFHPTAQYIISVQ